MLESEGILGSSHQIQLLGQFHISKRKELTGSASQGKFWRLCERNATRWRLLKTSHFGQYFLHNPYFKLRIRISIEHLHQYRACIINHGIQDLPCGRLSSYPDWSCVEKQCIGPKLVVWDEAPVEDDAVNRNKDNLRSRLQQNVFQWMLKKFWSPSKHFPI